MTARWDLLSVISPSFAQEEAEAQRLDHLPGVRAKLAPEPTVQTLTIAPCDMRQPDLSVTTCRPRPGQIEGGYPGGPAAMCWVLVAGAAPYP